MAAKVGRVAWPRVWPTVCLPHSAVDSKRAVSDTDRMIRASAALYYWFGFPTISAEGRMRVI
jgi:hypothetical protein